MATDVNGPNDYVELGIANPDVQFTLEVSRDSQNIATNTTRLKMYIRADSNEIQSGIDPPHGPNVVGSVMATVDNFSYPPQGYNSSPDRFFGVVPYYPNQIWRKGPWYFDIPHGTNGRRGAVRVRLTVEYGGQDGTASASFNDFPDLGKVPNKTTPGIIDGRTQTKMKYHFTPDATQVPYYPDLGYQVMFSTDPNALNAAIADIPLGTTELEILGLHAGTTYYFWSRTKNAAGVSDWSDDVTDRTMGGLQARQSGSWREAMIYVKVNGHWTDALVYQKILVPILNTHQWELTVSEQDPNKT